MTRRLYASIENSVGQRFGKMSSEQKKPKVHRLLVNPKKTPEMMRRQAEAMLRAYDEDYGCAIEWEPLDKDEKSQASPPEKSEE